MGSVEPHAHLDNVLLLADDGRGKQQRCRGPSMEQSPVQALELGRQSEWQPCEWLRGDVVNRKVMDIDTVCRAYTVDN